MNKNEYLRVLEQSLNGIPFEDKKDIMYDYEEHFTIGLQEGKTEEEIAQSLGHPRTLAKQFRANYIVNQAKSDSSTGNVFRAIFAVISLGFFNLIFVLGPFLGLIGVLIGLFATSFGLIVAGFAVFVAIFISPFTIPFVGYTGSISVSLSPIVLIFISIGLTSFGTLFFIGSSYLAKLLFRGIIKYLQMNLNIIKKGEI